jgi:hypothetical protein
MTQPDWLQACDKATNIMTFRWLGQGVYACEQANGEVSLVDRETLINMIRQQYRGGTNEVGGGSVGRA